MKTSNPKLYEKISKFDFSDHMLYDYDYEYNCEDNNCDGICRCGTIVNFQIESVVLNENFINKFFRLYNKDIKSDQYIFKYALDRIFESYIKKYDYEIFRPNIIHSYYGEELQGVHLEDFELIELLIKIKNFNHTKLIEQILITEYGYILDSLKDCHYEKEDLHFDDIKILNHKYVQKLDQSLIDKYQDYWSFRAIIDNNYRLIDGYHRTMAAKDNPNSFYVLRAIKNGHH